MAQRFRKGAAYRRPSRSFAPAAPRPQALSSAIVDAVLRYSDVQEDVGGGRVMKRLSPARLNEVAVALGKDAAQAGRVSILWNDREDQIVRVLVAPVQSLAA